MHRNISFHPKFAAALDAALGVVMIWWLSQISAWWMLAVWIVFRAALWGALVRLVFYPREISRLRHFFSLVVFSVGSVFFLLFIEWNIAWNLIALFSIFLSTGSFWLLPPMESKLPFMPKPHRRWLLFLNLFGIAGMWSGVYAVSAFQILYRVNSWIWLLLVSSAAAAISGWWWREYGIVRDKRFYVYLCVWFLLILELSWAVSFLPLGFFASGLFLTWAWYCLWLMARFNLSKEGINWKKQKWFLTSNVGLMIIFLALLVRWK